MAEGRPHLVAVDAPSPSEAPAETSPPNRLPLVLLAVALAVCAIGWLQSRGEAGRLAGELAATQDALAAANGRLAAEEARRAAVRDQVQGLRVDASAFVGRLAELEALVVEDLAAEGPAAAGSADADHGQAADTQSTGNEATSRH